MLDEIFVVLVNIVRMRKNIIQMMCWGHIWSSMNSWRIIDVGINIGEEGLNEVEIIDSYLEREVPTSVEEEEDDVNEIDILGFTDDDIEFQVHNIVEMVWNVDRHGNDDQYSNDELAKYKKMIEDSKKPFYYCCAAQYTRLFAMVKLFQLKASNEWSDGSFKDLLTLLNDMLPQGNTVPETVYEAK
jgi:hypothetical protein